MNPFARFFRAIMRLFSPDPVVIALADLARQVEQDCAEETDREHT